MALVKVGGGPLDRVFTLVAGRTCENVGARGNDIEEDNVHLPPHKKHGKSPVGEAR